MFGKYQNMPTYGEITTAARKLFIQKNHDYGDAWRILRMSSITDQIFIKAWRIRTLETTTNKVGESIKAEYLGIINYGIIALMQMKLLACDHKELEANEIISLYDTETAEIAELMQAKTHDYDDAWKDLRPSTFTDLILMKLLRIRQIEDNEGKLLASEGIGAGYQDIVNYAIFARIRLNKK